MEQKPVVLVIDEAQAMPEETIEALRLLTNLETESIRLLQVVLFGQPELDVLLRKQSLRQLNQRITFHYRLAPLDRNSVAQYLRHRLAQAGYNGADLFAPGALRLITRASGGIPRLVNILAHKSMLAAWGRGDRLLSEAMPCRLSAIPRASAAWPDRGGESLNDALRAAEQRQSRPEVAAAYARHSATGAVAWIMGLVLSRRSIGASVFCHDSDSGEECRPR